MRDKQHRDFAPKLIDGTGKLFGCRIVQAIRCFVKYQYSRPLKQGASDCNALLLPTRKANPVFTYLSLISLGKTYNGVVNFHHFAGFDDLFKARERIGHVSARRNNAPISPFLLQRSAATRMRRLSIGENGRRLAVAATSGSGGGAMDDASSGALRDPCNISSIAETD